MDAQMVHAQGAFVGAVKGHEVRLEHSWAGAVASSGAMTIHNGGCGPVAVGGSLSITNGGCGPVLAGGDVSFTNGGTQTVISAGGARVGSHGFVGMVLSPSVTVEDGGRVLMNTPQAIAAGAAAGAALGLLLRALRK